MKGKKESYIADFHLNITESCCVGLGSEDHLGSTMVEHRK